MSHLSIAQSDTIRAAFRVARDAIVACDPLTIAQHHETLSVVIYTAVRALGLPAVRGEGQALSGDALGDILSNLTTVVDFDLTLLEIDAGRDLTALVADAREFMMGMHSLSPSEHAVEA